jgi:hypothetical protein
VLCGRLLPAVLCFVVLGRGPFWVPVLVPALAYLGVTVLSVLFAEPRIQSLRRPQRWASISGINTEDAGQKRLVHRPNLRLDLLRQGSYPEVEGVHKKSPLKAAKPQVFPPTSPSTPLPRTAARRGGASRSGRHVRAVPRLLSRTTRRPGKARPDPHPTLGGLLLSFFNKCGEISRFGVDRASHTWNNAQRYVNPHEGGRS